MTSSWIGRRRQRRKKNEREIVFLLPDFFPLFSMIYWNFLTTRFMIASNKTNGRVLCGITTPQLLSLQLQNNSFTNFLIQLMIIQCTVSGYCSEFWFCSKFSFDTRFFSKALVLHKSLFLIQILNWFDLRSLFKDSHV